MIKWRRPSIALSLARDAFTHSCFEIDFVISLINSTDKYESLIEKIENEFKNIKFSESDLERKKKVLISNEVFSYENIEMVNEMIIDNIIFDGRIEEDIIDIINGLNMEELMSIVSKIDFDNKSIVILKK